MSSDSDNAELSGALSSLDIGNDEMNIQEKETTNNDTDINTATKCANCGKEREGDSMNACNKCDLVKYCNAACKKKHKSKHKKKCERRVAELYDEKLFKEPPPPEDCPICFLPQPIDASESTFFACCGKMICSGCCCAMVEKEGANTLCAFCRTPGAKSYEEDVGRVMKLMEKGNARAFYNLASDYARGCTGMAQDWLKAHELYLKAGELGCAEAYSNLGCSYDNGTGVEIDKEKAKQYWELAAMNGSVIARYNLGYIEVQADNLQRAYKHFTLAARAGYKQSLDVVKIGYKHGLVTKDEYAQTLRAYQKRADEMKSEARDKAVDIDMTQT